MTVVVRSRMKFLHLRPALERYCIIATMDADGQHRMADAKKSVKLLRRVFLRTVVG